MHAEHLAELTVNYFSELLFTTALLLTLSEVGTAEPLEPLSGIT